MPRAASWPISRNGVPGSSSCSTRSRGSSLPRAVWRSRAAGAAALRHLRGLGAQVVDERHACASALARNSSRAGVDLRLQDLHLLCFLSAARVARSVQRLHRRIAVFFPVRCVPSMLSPTRRSSPSARPNTRPCTCDAWPRCQARPQDRGAADVGHLLDHVQLDQPPAARDVVAQIGQARRVFVGHVLDMAQPVVGQARPSVVRPPPARRRSRSGRRPSRVRPSAPRPRTAAPTGSSDRSARPGWRRCGARTPHPGRGR